jgi:uncharacterized protein
MFRVVHFEIPTDNPERALDFYGKMFGWKFQKYPGPQDYWLAITGSDGQRGINGGIMRRPKGPGAATVNTVEVEDLDKSIRDAEANGGKQVVPRMAIPGVGYLAYCADPEGNVFGMMQADLAAK